MKILIHLVNNFDSCYYKVGILLIVVKTLMMLTMKMMKENKMEYIINLILFLPEIHLNQINLLDYTEDN
ncbi:unnamed protein product [Schistosoma mattheei]|uniref:Uncharacterized protein n=1 Tax=Schistosoma mattheei TaxID=31246 RepID=A0A183PZX4_9TREM|nr:unnamed protein product [Schistosoma mattheei]